MSDAIRRLYDAVLFARGEDPKASRTARLFADGRTKIAKKVVEEAAEVALDAARGDRDGVIRETADLLYQLAVLWAEMGVSPAEIWHEMEERERTLGLAGKLPKEEGR